MTEIRGSGEPLSPRDKQLYQQEFKHAADLFQRSLDQYAKSDNPYQKEEFKEVMDKAMRVLNETAQELMKNELLKQNEKIAQDWATYQQNESVDAQKQLSKDLDKAKRSV